MSEPAESAPRLDSWKAIADYLSRDVATVRRWEKSLGLPIRRVGPGHSVFAYPSEIDAWLKTSPGNGATHPATADERPVAPSPPTSATAYPRPVRRWRTLAAVAAFVIVAIAFGWRFQRVATDERFSAVAATDGIALVGADGIERWRHRYAPGQRLAFPHRQPEVVLAGGEMAVVGAVSLRVIAGDVTAGGELLRLTGGGRLDRSFAFDDRVSFGARSFGEPWIISDFRVDSHDGAARVALVGRHTQWWPSLITVLDDKWHRTGTFVHAGWVEWVEWMAPDRLLIAGFSNPRDGGMIALLDPNALDGQSPVERDSPYRCGACGDNRPIRYIVLPRSEVNRATASPFNRVTIERIGRGIVAHTLEVPIDTTMRNADALYEFSADLELLRASYSDRYWELHRALEADGKIAHSREQCPDRDGPRTIESWEPAAGWQTVTVPR